MSGTLLADAVTWLFTSVLKGLQMHGQHDGCMASLVHLAFQIYEMLVSGRQGGTAGGPAASLNLPPRISSCGPNPGICHTAYAARGEGVPWHGEGDRPNLHPLSSFPA